jgi:hypothetical protein
MRILARLILLSAISLWYSTGYTQTEKEALRAKLKDATFNQKFDVALNLDYDKAYIDALYLWQILAEEDEKNANIQYKIGMSYIHLNKEIDALQHFERAKYSVNRNYNPTLFTERNAPTDVLYYLAKSNHINGNIDTAATQYNYFVENAHPKHELYQLALLGQKQIENARRLMANPKDFIIQNMGSFVNTPAPEYSPAISIDGSTLFFTSKRLRTDSTNFEHISYENGLHYEDIYVAYRDREGNWSTPEYLGFCKPQRNDASISTSADGQTVFVYQDINGGDIFYSEINDTAYNSIEPYPAPELNTEFWESHATISNNEDYLYFVSDRPSGFGGRDIYRLKKLPNGEWSKAFNLGPSINSAYDEESPFLGADNKTMYFSSNGKNSMGGFDIFVAQIDENDVWSEPVNMGYPLNTVNDDVFYTTTADGRTGYYSAERGDGFGDKDIYTIYSENDFIQNIAVLNGFILTSDGSQIPPGISIEVRDQSDDQSVRKYSLRGRDGGYVLTLIPCHIYTINYLLDQKDTFHTMELFVPCSSSYQEIQHELLLDMVDFSVKQIFTPQDSVIAERKEQGMPCNLVYKIQVGAFKNHLPAAYYKKYNPNSTELLGNGITRYMLGVFDEYILAEQFRQEVLSTYPDAFVVAYLNAVRINTSTARDLENGLIACDENIYPKFECQQDSIANYTKLINSPVFYHYYSYDKDEFDYKNENFRVFVKSIKEIIDQGLPVTVYITSSASHVPTKAYKDNQDLAAQRLDNGRTTILKLLEEFGIDIAKINIVMKEVKVNGPKYNNDAEKNQDMYGKYQYIKFELQF